MIAMTRHSATDYLSTLVIDSVKTKYDVYRVQINDLNIRLRMLLNNEMDAAWMPEPYATQARMAKHVALADSRDKEPPVGSDCLPQQTEDGTPKKRIKSTDS